MLTAYGDFARIASEMPDIALDPLEPGALVEQTVVWAGGRVVPDGRAREVPQEAELRGNSKECESGSRNDIHGTGWRSL